MLGDVNKNCVAEILVVLRVRYAIAVDIVRFLWCSLHTECHPQKTVT